MVVEGADGLEQTENLSFVMSTAGFETALLFAWQCQMDVADNCFCLDFVALVTGKALVVNAIFYLFFSSLTLGNPLG